jgi:hypothetical protein
MTMQGGGDTQNSVSQCSKLVRSAVGISNVVFSVAGAVAKGAWLLDELAKAVERTDRPGCLVQSEAAKFPAKQSTEV